MSPPTTCPACGHQQVNYRFNWRAILYAIFCFPCGFYCCLKRKTYFCSRCQCDVVRTSTPTIHNKLGYNYRLYESTETGLPASAAYRNYANTDSSTSSRDSTTSSTSPIVEF